MSSKRKIKHMTSEELKSKLFSHFQKNGSFDQLRTQLRGQLVSELFKVAEPIGSKDFPSASDTDKHLLPIQVCNWLVYDHLLRQDYQYSLSVFVMEAHLPFPEKFLTAGDVLGLLGLNNSGTDSQNISKLYSDKNELGHLHSLLLAIIKVLFSVPLKILTTNYNLDTNEEYLFKKEESKDSKEVVDISDAKQQQIHDGKQFSLDKGLLSNNFEKTLETDFHEQLQSVKEENEKEVQKLRHKLLKELEKFHEQEHKMHLEFEFTKAELRQEQDKLLKDTELLKEKECLLEKEMVNKFERKVRDVETEFASKFHLKEKEIELLNSALNEKEQELTSTKAELLGEKNSQSILKQDLEDMKRMHKIIQDKYSAILDENTNLLKKFESMADYTIMKEELSAKTREVFQLQQEIRDVSQRSEAERKKYVETVGILENSLSTKEPQLIQTQKELDYMKNTLSKEERNWNAERKILEQELMSFKELYKNLMQRVEDQNEDIKDLHKTIHTLNYKFTNDSLNFKRTEYFNNRQHLENIGTVDDKSNGLFVKTNANFPYKYSMNSKDWSLQFLSEAKNHLTQLKQEEKKIQEKCVHIFSMIPEDKKSAKTSNTENYSFHAVSQPTLLRTSNCDDWHKNKIGNNKNTYSLNDIKQLVTRSLFSYETNYPTNFHSNVEGLEATHKSNNKVNDWFKSSINMSTVDSEPNLTGNYKNTAIKDNGNDSENTHKILHNLEHQKRTISTDQTPTEIENEPLKSSNNVQQITSSKDTSLDSQTPIGTKTQLQIETSQINQQVFAGDKSKPSKPVSVNLDDAWKRRTSNPSSLPQLERLSRTETSKDKNYIYFNPFESPNDKSIPGLENKNIAVTNKPSTFESTTNESLVVTESDNAKIVIRSNMVKPLDIIHKETGLESTFTFNLQESSSSNLERENSVVNSTKSSTTNNFPKNNNSLLQSTKSDTGNLDFRTNNEQSDPNSKSAEVQENAQIRNNTKGDDSISELSEIHLSCGSEPEVQKEDSDAW